MLVYLDLMKDILAQGVQKEDRTGVGTLSVFGRQMRFDLSQGFPLVTTKKVHLKSIIYELLWFLRGDTNIKYLQEHNVTIWNEWADANGELGEGIYGSMWRSWPNPDGTHIDQISQVIEQIRTNPNSRRMIVVAFNPSFADKTPLPPCHSLFQFHVAAGKLSCQLYQRSADMFLGVPFNIASYALLTHMIAEQCDLDLGDFIWTGGDCHLYSNHFEQVHLQLSRSPYPLPQLVIKRKPASIFEYQYEDFEVVNYQHHSAIKAAVAV